MPDLHGAIVLEPSSGELERRPGFVLDTARIADVTVGRHRFALRGDVLSGYFTKIDDKVEVGPFPTPERATWYAKVYAGMLERAA